ncbi:MAG: imidazole glycerol phosphate synthase subunit HisH [Gemmiger sp.]|nr:imidazole glycerol phosphate synthase subunit HisH [Gemmiger sp.]
MTNVQQPEITMVDYGLSNIFSVRHAFEHFGASVVVTDDPAQVLAARALVLPGVGAFRDGMAGLTRLGLVEPLCRKAAEGTPLLGICLGMQMLFDASEEFGSYRGLGLIPGRVVKIPGVDADGNPQRVPHIRWDPLYPAGGHPDFSGTALRGVTPGQECYFIHSYEAKPQNPADCLAETVYGGRRICAVARRGSVLGTQFHPEKSGPVGLSIIQNYLALCGQ